VSQAPFLWAFHFNVEEIVESSYPFSFRLASAVFGHELLTIQILLLRFALAWQQVECQSVTAVCTTEQ
jgi:hypothetical protein